ncbi:MAG TPA: Ig-like domain-containing protein, partial [Acidimicrobiales bacterium]|nr:Ig-like domain-containing protein [Acidimicrobiales bacterium]
MSVTAIDNDVSGPLVQISAPANGATVQGANAEFFGGSNLDGSTVRGEFYVDSVLKFTDLGAGHYHYNGSHQSWDTTQLKEGTHNLRLTVVDANNRSGSHDIQVTVDNLPAPWDHQDIGAVGAAGGASASGGLFTVKAAGADIWGAADELHYVFQPLGANTQVTARVTGVQNTNAWSKAGVMLRASTAADSAHAFMLLSGGGTISFQRRLANAGASTSTNIAGGTSPLWVRLARSGTTVTASYSTNGTSWTTAGSDSVALGSTPLVGLALTSHADPTVATATFDSVTVGTGGGTCTPETDAAFCSRMAKN